MRLHTLKIGAELRVQAAARSDPAAPSITVTLDSTFIRSCEDGERHLEVRIGNVETEAGGRQVFGAVAKADTDIKVLIRRSLDAVGRTEDTALTAFTDGCSGLPRILADAGVTEAPVLDWFHIAMRLQHLEQTAGGLSADDPARVAAKAVIVAEVERLHWRLWNGKAKDAQISIGRIRAVMHHFQGEQGQRRSIAPSRKLQGNRLNGSCGDVGGEGVFIPCDDFAAHAQRILAFSRSEHVEGDVLDDGEVEGGVISSHTAFVVAEDHVEHPVEAVFDHPVAADHRSQGVGQQGKRGDVETRLGFDLAVDFSFALDHDDRLQARPLVVFLQPADVVESGDRAGLDAAVVAVDGRV